MYNFTIPTQLKAHFDLVARAGLTAYLVLSSGGDHRGEASDFVTPYVKLMLGFIGITDVHVITAAGTAMDKETALTSAQEAISSL